MKKTLLILLFLLFFVVTSDGKSFLLFDENGLEKIELIEKNTGTSNPQRTVEHDVNVYLSVATTTVVAELHNIGVAIVMIVNSVGQIVSYDTVNTSFPITLNIVLPDCPDLYHIEVNAPNYFARGFFNLY